MGGETTATPAAAAAAAPPAAAAGSPAGDMHIKVECKFEQAAISATTDAGSLLVQLTAPEYEQEERPAVDIVPVLDVSGSMSGSKLKLAIETLRFIIRNLKATDRFGLVTFDSSVTKVADLMPMTQANKEKLIAKIERLRAGSCTNLSGGLFEGMKMMASRGKPNPVRSILLLTDGIANEGIRDIHSLVPAMRKMMGEKPSYTVYTFGYGGDHNADFLKQLSEAGNGMYYYIETNDTISTSFADCLGGLLSTCAQNIQLTLKSLADGYAIKKICTSRTSKLEAGGTLATVELGDLQSEEQRDVLFEVTLPVLVNAHDEARSVFEVQVSYVNVITSAFDSALAEASLARPAEVPADLERDASVRDAVDRHKATAAMEKARVAADAGRLAEARDCLNAELALLRENESAAACAIAEDMDEFVANLSSTAQYNAVGSKCMASAVQSHSAQRSNRVWAGQEERGAYVTKRKKAMKAAAKGK
jgi:Mg-chelatase subunit ChlD